MFLSYKGVKPVVGSSVFVAENATVIGRVRIADYSSVWFGAVLRGDIADIEIGKYTNVQDLVVVHVDNGVPTVIGDYVTIGHSAVIHGCKIGSYTLVGMGAVVLTGADVGEGSVIGAGAVVRENEKIPPRSLVVGVPGRVVRTLSDEDVEVLKEHALQYYELSATFL